MGRSTIGGCSRSRRCCRRSCAASKRIRGWCWRRRRARARPRSAAGAAGCAVAAGQEDRDAGAAPVAARCSAAMFMARQRGEEVGATVGYRIRFENKVSARTRIEVVTEGILTRMLQDDPTLEGVGALLFDEFHERHRPATSDLRWHWTCRRRCARTCGSWRCRPRSTASGWRRSSMRHGCRAEGGPRAHRTRSARRDEALNRRCGVRSNTRWRSIRATCWCSCRGVARSRGSRKHWRPSMPTCWNCTATCPSSSNRACCSRPATAAAAWCWRRMSPSPASPCPACAWSSTAGLRASRATTPTAASRGWTWWRSRRRRPTSARGAPAASRKAGSPAVAAVAAAGAAAAAGDRTGRTRIARARTRGLGQRRIALRRCSADRRDGGRARPVAAAGGAGSACDHAARPAHAALGTHPRLAAMLLAARSDDERALACDLGAGRSARSAEGAQRRLARTLAGAAAFRPGARQRRCASRRAGRDRCGGETMAASRRCAATAAGHVAAWTGDLLSHAFPDRIGRVHPRDPQRYALERTDGPHRRRQRLARRTVDRRRRRRFEAKDSLVLRGAPVDESRLCVDFGSASSSDETRWMRQARWWPSACAASTASCWMRVRPGARILRWRRGR